MPFQEPRHRYVTTASSHDTPEDTHIQAPGSSRSGAIWSTRTSAADASGLVSNNSNNNHKFELRGGGGMYGSTDGARVEHLTESGAAPTNIMDGAAAVFGGNNVVVGPLENTSLLSRAAEESANVEPGTVDIVVRSTSGENGEAGDGSSGQDVDGGEGESMCGCSLGAISRPLAACLFGYFVNKLVSEVSGSIRFFKCYLETMLRLKNVQSMELGFDEVGARSEKG